MTAAARWSPFLRIFLASKMLIALLLILGANLSFDSEYAQSRLHWGDINLFKTHLAAWDSAHYLTISQEGYHFDSASCAFFPLWPSVIHPLGLLHFAGPLFWALLAANALSIPALWLFYKYVKMRHGPSVARDSLILLLAFPGAIFFSVPYTESLYFLLLIFEGALRKWVFPQLSGPLLIVRDPIGLLIIWEAYRTHKWPKEWSAVV